MRCCGVEVRASASKIKFLSPCVKIRTVLLARKCFVPPFASRFELQAGGYRLLPMEGLRGISAFLVFFVHFYALFGTHILHSPIVHEAFFFASRLGHCGVDIFFALSGFIIYGLLNKQPCRYLDFVRRRILRLYPAFTVIFLLYLLMNFVRPVKPLPSSFSPLAEYLLANFLMLPGIFPIVPLITVAWSLSYELCFYLTLPLLVRWLRIAIWPNSVRVAFVLAVCGAHIWLSHWGILGHPRLVMFGCGILVRQTIQYRFPWTTAGNLVALTVFIFTLALYGFRGHTAWTQFSGPVVIASQFRIAALFVSTYGLLFFALKCNGFLSAWFSWKWIRLFGNISYSYYLVHGLVLHILNAGMDFLGLSKDLPVPWFLALFAFSFAATVVGAAAIFLAVEKPCSLSARSISLNTIGPGLTPPARAPALLFRDRMILRISLVVRRVS
jgi:exopolysaccharide production protein ExoZ